MTNDVQTITFEDYVVEIRQRRFHHGMRPSEYHANTRVYVSSKVVMAKATDKLLRLDKEEAELGERRWAEKGKFPEVDKLYAQLNREYAKVAREIATEAVQKILVPGRQRDTISARFSRRAGCSCPCSPGVILSQVVRVDSTSAPVDIWISLKA